MLGSQLLRHRRLDVDDRRSCEEDLYVERDVKEGLAQNVDVEVIHD